MSRDGTYRLEGISPGSGDLQLLVERAGAHESVQSIPITLADGEVKECNLSMSLSEDVSETVD